jgi:hypothetical protein
MALTTDVGPSGPVDRPEGALDSTLALTKQIAIANFDTIFPCVGSLACPAGLYGTPSVADAVRTTADRCASR